MEKSLILECLRNMAGNNQFAQSLIGQYNDRGRLSEKQWDAAERMILRAEKTAETKARLSTELDMSRILALFETAMNNGLKRPVFRSGPIALSIAGSTSRNAGMIYVKFGGEYSGKIDFAGLFHPVVECPEMLPGELQAIARDPLGSAIAHGRITGNCACCGRELSDPESVKRGIGPICAAKWGLA